MKKITLRLPDDLHQELGYIADQQERSLNRQILYLLRQATGRQSHAAASATDGQTVAPHGERALEGR